MQQRWPCSRGGHAAEVGTWEWRTAEGDTGIVGSFKMVTMEPDGLTGAPIGQELSWGCGGTLHGFTVGEANMSA